MLLLLGPNAPQINPNTGQPDYSAQWVEYYKSIGMMKEAAVVEEQAKLNKVTYIKYEVALNEILKQFFDRNSSISTIFPMF